ncbi:MAG TPA: hypothetical protein VFC39_13620 [Acidobacteriaceae bacterium]|nr:hypothetical protein [Acidobacteriaceae bacterium]
MQPLSRRLIVITASTIAIALAIWAAVPTAAHKQVLAGDLPPGALLTIESPDFAGLLHAWNASPEQAAWFNSANYSAFANSRLFGRLSDAQGEFAGVAGSKADAAFLQQVAGKESIFAWYDISKLEFVYISHLPAGQTARVDLLQQRGKFSRRESGGDSFYVKTSASSDADDAGPSSPRTVAFATRGDWLILGTREDLVANTLLLMQQQETGKQPQSSEDSEGWYSAAETAGPAKRGDLHMLLDLQRITATPAFRTYWIQRNVTDTRQYRAAVVDLYREPHSFREERVLLPNSSANDAATQPDLAAVEALVPERAGVYRAIALPNPEDTLATLDEKLLTRSTSSVVESTAAPAADLSVSQPGSESDLETRIDTLSPKPEPASAPTAPLLATLKAANITSMLTIDRTDPPVAGALFVPIRSAVILRSTNPWDSNRLQAALLTALRSHLTVGSLGLAWTRADSGYSSLGATHPFALFVDGHTAVLANDAALMNDILARRQTPATTPQPATLIAGFRHSQERADFARLTASLAYTNVPANPAPNQAQSPDFFAGSIGSLSNAFRALATERLVERRDGPLTRQTVVYTWQTP